MQMPTIISNQFFLMFYPIHIDIISMELSILYFKGSQVKRCISVPEDCFILANSADPDEMQPYVVFHRGLHCLPKYLFTSIQNVKD